MTTVSRPAAQKTRQKKYYTQSIILSLTEKNRKLQSPKSRNHQSFTQESAKTLSQVSNYTIQDHHNCKIKTTNTVKQKQKRRKQDAASASLIITPTTEKILIKKFELPTEKEEKNDPRTALTFFLDWRMHKSLTSGEKKSIQEDVST